MYFCHWFPRARARRRLVDCRHLRRLEGNERFSEPVLPRTATTGTSRRTLTPDRPAFRRGVGDALVVSPMDGCHPLGALRLRHCGLRLVLPGGKPAGPVGRFRGVLFLMGALWLWRGPRGCRRRAVGETPNITPVPAPAAAPAAPPPGADATARRSIPLMRHDCQKIRVQKKCVKEKSNAKNDLPFGRTESFCGQAGGHAPIGPDSAGYPGAARPK